MQNESHYFKLLKEKYPTKQTVCREIINLNAIINLPKGTEHFMSDLHGEYEAFLHILNNCSGVVREKVDALWGETLSSVERNEKTTGIAGYTLIYNSHGMRIKAHQPFESVEKALEENKDIESTSRMFETEPARMLVGDTDAGKELKEDIEMLTQLLDEYRKGRI